jgi:1-acyl-sn-glycerol-3-phosphate acyltransferase
MNPSIVWLCLLALLFAGYLWHLNYRRVYTFPETCLYVPVYLLGRLLWRVTFTNEAPAAIKSGAILAANHRSSVDPLMVQLAAGRRVHWMVAKEYCQHSVLGLLLKLAQVIPTNRSGMDLTSTKRAMELTAHGRLIGMFPEGRINTTGQVLLPVRAGAALVAIKSQVPIIPILIEGSPYNGSVITPLITPARVTITFGIPIYGCSDSGVPECRSPSAKYDQNPSMRPALQAAVESVGSQDTTEIDRSQWTNSHVQSKHLIQCWADQLLVIARRRRYHP